MEGRLIMEKTMELKDYFSEEKLEELRGIIKNQFNF